MSKAFASTHYSQDSSQSVDPSRIAWAHTLLRYSPLKQRKVSKLTKFMQDVQGKTCLDIGGDNGVVSLALREKGGTWSSVDLIPETVASIQSLVGERVFLIDGKSTPFTDQEFDVVVVADYLEHIETDALFVRELHRILKPQGTLVLNVPNPKQGLLRRVRFALGQTDEAHGHVRPGYTLGQLQALLGSSFSIVATESYSRVFSEVVDTIINAALKYVKGLGGSKKGTVVKQQDFSSMKNSFKVYRFIYPTMLAMTKLDELIPWAHGNMLIVRARRK